MVLVGHVARGWMLCLAARAAKYRARAACYSSACCALGAPWSVVWAPCHGTTYPEKCVLHVRHFFAHTSHRILHILHTTREWATWHSKKHVPRTDFFARYAAWCFFFTFQFFQKIPSLSKRGLIGPVGA